MVKYQIQNLKKVRNRVVDKVVMTFMEIKFLEIADERERETER